MRHIAGKSHPTVKTLLRRALAAVFGTHIELYLHRGQILGDLLLERGVRRARIAVGDGNDEVTEILRRKLPEAQFGALAHDADLIVTPHEISESALEHLMSKAKSGAIIAGALHGQSRIRNSGIAFQTAPDALWYTTKE